MTFLQVPYAEKDQARELGARWNPGRKRWYVPPGLALAPFERWLPMGGEPPPAAARADARAAKLATGERFLAIEHACNPFEPCAQCAPLLAESGWSAARAAVLAALKALDRDR